MATKEEVNDREIDSLIRDAMSATDKEIFADAFGKDEPVLDETDDRWVEVMGDGLEGQREAEESEDDSEKDDAEETETEGEAQETEKDKAEKKDGEKAEPDKAEAKPEKPEGRVPSGKLREANERARAAEAEREALKAERETERAQSRKELDELKAKFDGMLQVLQRQQPQPAKAEAPKVDTPPDLWEDPNGFFAHRDKTRQSELSRIEQAINNLRIQNSMQVARAIHGEAFEKARAAAAKFDPNNDDDNQTAMRIFTAPNPGDALVQWHKRAETLRIVGDDPAKYEETIQAKAREALMKDPEFRKQLIAELREEAGIANNGKLNTLTRLPPKLNGAPGPAANRDTDLAALGDGSDESIFESAWRT